MLLYRSPQLFSVLHTPLVFCPVSVTFLLRFHSSPVFSALHLFSLFSIALSTVLSTISAQGNITVSSTRQFFVKQTCSNQDCSFYTTPIVTVVFSSFSIITLYDDLTISHFQLLDRIVGMHFTSDCNLFTRVLPPQPPPPPPT